MAWQTAALIGKSLASKFGTEIATSAGANIMGKLFGGSGSAAKAAAQQYKYNLALQQQQQQWNEYMYKNRYTFQRQDMENAGINPLFGMGQAPTVTSGTNSVGMADMVGEQNNKFNQMMSLLDFGQNLSAKRAQTKLIERQAQTEEQNTLLKTAEVLEKQINNKYLSKQRKTELKKMQAETLEILAKTNESYATKKLIEANTKSSARDYKIQEEFDKKHPIAKEFANAMRRFGFGGSLGVSLPLRK